MTAARAAAARPFPADPLERWVPHFEALEEGRILVRRCATCGTLQWPPRVCCRACTATEFAAVEAATEGTVYSLTLCHRAFHPWFEPRTPFALVLVDCDPGVRVLGNCFSSAASDLACGQRVRAGFDTRAENRVVLTWEPLA